MKEEIDKTRIVEEVPGVPETEKYYLWHNHKVEAYFRTKQEAVEYCQANAIDVDEFEPFLGY